MTGTDDQRPLRIDPHALDLSDCIDRVQTVVEAVRSAGADYFNSTPVVEIRDEATAADGRALSWAVPIDLATLSAVAAIAQTPLGLKGATDRGKSALGERVLTGLFGQHGVGWWRIEVNRGMSVDDLLDVDWDKTKLSEALAAAKWLSMPAVLLDEINRAHAKLINLVIHLVDGSGFNVRGDLNIPVGMPYRVGSEEKRYAFAITTANHVTNEYSGTYEEDHALVRRTTLSVDIDETPQTIRDRVRMLNARRAKATVRTGQPCTRQVVELYETLPSVLPCSGLAVLFLHYLAGRDTCVRTRSGKLKPSLKPGICETCHLAKSSRWCGRVGGLSEGLLLAVRELAVALAAVRAAGVIEQVGAQCRSSDRGDLAVRNLQHVLQTKARGDELFEAFRRWYLGRLCVTGEDVKAAYALAGPSHVWIDLDWLAAQTTYEFNPVYVLRDAAEDGWHALHHFLTSHHELVAALAGKRDLSSAEQSAIETCISNEDAAVMSVVGALRDEELPVSFRRELADGAASRAA